MCWPPASCASPEGGLCARCALLPISLSLQCVQVSVLTVLAPQHRLAPTPDTWCYWKKLVCSVWAYPAAGHLPLGLSPPLLYSKFRTKPSGTRLCRVCVYVCAYVGVHVHTCVRVCTRLCVFVCIRVCPCAWVSRRKVNKILSEVVTVKYSESSDMDTSVGLPKERACPLI